MANYTKIILRGVGQVMFQNNVLSGLLILIGIFYNSWILGIAAIIGTIISTGAAQVLKYSKDEIEDGIYGFNGALVGVALWFFFGIGPVTLIAIILGSILSSILMHEMKKVVPPFTAPFVLTTWLFILVLIFIFQLPQVAPPLPESDSFDLFTAISKGFSEVWFQDNVITGIFFFIALLVNSRSAAIYALSGSLIGALFAIVLSQPFTLVNGGILGYNAVLCAIALGGDLKWRTLLSVIIAIVLSVLLNIFLAGVGVIPLTAAFVSATWVVLAIQFISKKYSARKDVNLFQ